MTDAPIQTPESLTAADAAFNAAPPLLFGEQLKPFAGLRYTAFVHVLQTVLGADFRNSSVMSVIMFAWLSTVETSRVYRAMRLPAEAFDEANKWAVEKSLTIDNAVAFNHAAQITRDTIEAIEANAPKGEAAGNAATEI